VFTLGPTALVIFITLFSGKCKALVCKSTGPNQRERERERERAREKRHRRGAQGFDDLENPAAAADHHV